MIFAVLLTFLSLWETIMAQYVIIAEDVHHCSLDSKVLVNYNYSNVTNRGRGYIEVFENIEASSNILVSVDVRYKLPTESLSWINPKINIPKTSFCVFLNTDMIFLPYIRHYINFEKYCPIKKGKYEISKSTVLTKRVNPLHPLGCWDILAKFTQHDKDFACVQMIIQTAKLSPLNRTSCV